MDLIRHSGFLIIIYNYMKLACLQENLNQGLNITGHLVNKNVNLPILNNILLECQGGILKLSATNLEIGITCQVRGKVEEEGKFTVDSKLLGDYVGLLGNETVTLDLEKDDFLKVSSPNSETRIKGISADDFPVIPQVEKNQEYRLNIKDFKKALSQVIFAVSPNESRPEIGGVYMNFEEQHLTLTATDSYRLAEKKIMYQGEETEKKEVIVPVKTLQEVLRILNGLKDGVDTPESLEVYLADNQILFVINSIEVVSRLVEGKFPDYQQIIPKESKTQVLVENQQLMKTIKRVALFSKTGIFDVNLEIVPPSGLLVSSTNTQIGESTSEIESEITGEKNTTVLNYRYLLDGLNNISTDKISLLLIDNNLPCVIKPENDSTYVYIVMPIKQ